eukprot:2470373-Amphidinium_carterae.2
MAPLLGAVLCVHCQASLSIGDQVPSHHVLQSTCMLVCHVLPSLTWPIHATLPQPAGLRPFLPPASAVASAQSSVLLVTREPKATC